ncbi:hypothetical protein YC2023_079800 [Brassica napus]
MLLINLNSEVGLGSLVNNKEKRVFQILASGSGVGWIGHVEPVDSVQHESFTQLDRLGSVADFGFDRELDGGLSDLKRDLRRFGIQDGSPEFLNEQD